MIQNKTTIIGITGGMASGKTTVSNFLKTKGYKVIDADKIARDIVNIGENSYIEILNFFGDEILNQDKTINRKSLGTKIFNNKECRDKLNAITHPYIMDQINKEISENTKEKILFLDIPLLFEVYESIVNSGIMIDEIWLIYCDQETQIKRLMKRDNISYKDAKTRINSQMDIERKTNLADRVIDNTKREEDLIENIEKAIKKIS